MGGINSKKGNEMTAKTWYELPIKRRISQRCLGYQIDSSGNKTHSVFESVIQYKDKSEATIWVLKPIDSAFRKEQIFIDSCPRLDIQELQYQQ